MRRPAGAFLVPCALILLAAPAAAQRRDFLTEHEIDQIRVAQEPNERLAQYLIFARLRLELVKQTLAVEKPGRSKLVHDNLEDYTHIIEAIDTVIDDALARKLDIQKGVALVAEGEKEFQALLQEFAARPPKDAYLWEFALKDAADATADSLEESQHDLRARTERVLDEDAKDKKKREAAMSTAELGKRKEEQKQAEDKAKKAPKAPTLRRKGEVPKAP
jgi:hypothetical protein